MNKIEKSGQVAQASTVEAKTFTLLPGERPAHWNDPYVFDETHIAEQRETAEALFNRPVTDEELREILQAPMTQDCVLGKADPAKLYFDRTKPGNECPICHTKVAGLKPSKEPTGEEQQQIDLLVKSHRRLKAGLLSAQLGFQLARFGRGLIRLGEEMMHW